MSEGIFIKRHPAGELADSFASLRRQGIEQAQQLSGELWTDFNLHDPGVTILEQLAYAITELIYRADFPVADLLSGEDGIDYARQALYAPELIYPCRPTTLLDYRLAILDEVSELDNCWVKKWDKQAAVADGNYAGLYKILLKPDQSLSEAQCADVIEKVRCWYHSHRNLCEDVAEISLVKTQDCQLCAEVELVSAHRPVDILAEIYFNCASQIAGRVARHDYDQALLDELSLDEIFTGPFTSKGLLDVEELTGDSGEILISKLYAAINKVDGVDHVSTLHLKRNGKIIDDNPLDTEEAVLNLQIPQTDDDIIKFTVNGRIMPSVEPKELRARIDELNFRYYSSRSKSQDLSMLYSLPKGRTRQLAQYYSIQNQFPATYGIGSYGVPESASPEVKARAKQLKSYLLIFEQIMANYLANLSSIQRLFSLEKARHCSYSYMMLSDQQIAGLGDLYPEPERTSEILARIVADFDDYYERKSRLLDYLLALYGESFSQHSLQHFNFYYNPEEAEERSIVNKIDFLKAVVELGRDRGAAGNYCGTSWHERTSSGLQHRVARLLDFKRLSSGSLVMGLLDEGIKLARHHTYIHLKTGSHELKFIGMDDIETIDEASFNTLPLWENVKDLPRSKLREHIGDTIPLKNNLLSDILLRNGIYLDRFRVIRMRSRQDFQLCFFLSDENQYWYLGSYATRESGIKAANCLRRLLIHLNLESEGLHLLEHILLRPIGGASHENVNLPSGEDFYSFKISVIFPAWTARCHNLHFRQLAEETVRLNTPSHIYAEFYWLEFHEMYEFESLYEKWLNLKSKMPVDVAELNQLSASLIGFLLDKRNKRAANRRTDASP